MTMKFGVIVPQGWRMDLVGMKDPVEAYETMTRVAQTAEELGYDSMSVHCQSMGVAFVSGPAP
jgi:hypothetical protein